ncbi:pyridoxamine 5'-phosphate oxidase family protein [Phenylobacterium sp.]|uniref:pyridoxamine 5'-phosphate oxidase family protein n=1 Tax=Phenylobacterium sp. TaxID=1871053 RepID=UPI00289EADC9|nr:pyridoxamine 5'-phosphate oxidase family protein [Phenylobacterium sp.]
MSDTISSIAQLEDCVGAAGLPVKMKIIDHLDASAADWIAASPVAFVGLGGADGPSVAVAGGPAGFARVKDAGTLAIPLAAIDPGPAPQVGHGAGVLFLIPGIGETLRANGAVKAVSATELEIAIEECFVHCAKALIRSDFWSPGEGAAPTDPAAFVDASRFLALATMDAQGRIDISPKGDPAGLLIRMDGARATLAERPGNRLAFGYRNMIEQPKVAALCIIPGVLSVAVLRGQAHLTRDEAVRAAFVVDEKTPLLATVIDGARPAIAVSPALARAGLWASAPAAPKIDPAATLVAHLKLNKARGAQATLLRLAANRGLIAKGLESNYKTQLY